jgi:hypothetical protein
MSEKVNEHVKLAQIGFAIASERIAHRVSIRFIPRCKRNLRDKRRIKQGYI